MKFLREEGVAVAAFIISVTIISTILYFVIQSC